MTNSPSPESPQPKTEGLPTAGRVLLIIIGIVLLFPGLCAILFAGGFLLSDPLNTLRQADLIALWVVCLAISAGGILLIRKMRR